MKTTKDKKTTIKLPILNQIDISNIQQVYSSVVRYSYNRFVDKLSEKEIRHIIKDKGMFSLLLKYHIQCAIKEAKALYDANKVSGNINVVFGGMWNLKRYMKKQISKEEYKNNKLLAITIQGEAPKNGNRHFKFNIKKDNTLIFKFNEDRHYTIQLPKLRDNVKKTLFKLEELAKECKLPITIKLNTKFIWITYDERYLAEEKLVYKANRVLGIDMNPNYIGFSILEFAKNDTFKVIKKEVLDLNKLNTPLNAASNNPKKKKQSNKKKFEIIECAKYIVDVAKVYLCSKIVVEELNISSSDKKSGKKFNRLCNNDWLRNLFSTNLHKRCNLSCMEFVEVNTAYSSTVGNVLYGSFTTPDMVASSIEIARRGYRKYEKGWFYPSLPDDERLNELWKQTLVGVWQNWRELHVWIKESKLRYRFSLDVKNTSKVFRFSNIKSGISLYSFI